MILNINIKLLPYYKKCKTRFFKFVIVFISYNYCKIIENYGMNYK